MIRRWSSLADYPSPPPPDRADNDDGADEWWSFLNRLKALRSLTLVRNVSCTSPSSLLSPHISHRFAYHHPQSLYQLWNTAALSVTTVLLILLVRNCCVYSSEHMTALWHPVRAQHTTLKGKTILLTVLETRSSENPTEGIRRYVNFYRGYLKDSCPFWESRGN